MATGSPQTKDLNNLCSGLMVQGLQQTHLNLGALIIRAAYRLKGGWYIMVGIRIEGWRNQYD